jgi:hypothetical protein
MISPKYQCQCPGLAFEPETTPLVFYESEFRAFFKWPSIDEEPSWSDGVSLASEDWPDNGVLSTVGYRVGVNGIQDMNERCILLLRVFFSPVLPFVGGLHYMREWGPANSSQRLRKIAHSICSFANLSVRRSGTDVAVKHWKEDLHFLEVEIYNKMFPDENSWPAVDVE